MSILGLVGVLFAAFVAELLLAMRQQHVAANRPSTWLTLVASTVRRFFWNLGWIWAVWPDVFRWMRHVLLFLRDVFFRWIPREVRDFP